MKDPPPGPNFVEEEGSSRLQRTRAADDQRLLEPGGSQESLGSHDNHSVRPHDQRGTEDLRDQPCSNRIQQQNFSGGQRQDNSCQIQQNHDESEDYQGSNPSQSGGSRSPNQSQANSDISHWGKRTRFTTFFILSSQMIFVRKAKILFIFSHTPFLPLYHYKSLFSHFLTFFHQR